MEKGKNNPTSNLKRLRKEVGLTQAEMAEAIGCDTKTWRDYELENKSPRTSLLIEMRRFFREKGINVSTDYLLGFSDCRSVENDYISQITGLSDAAISTLADIKKVGHIYAGHSELDTLNFLLSDKWECSALLASIQDLFHAQYSIPVYHVETGKRTDEKGNETPLVETVLPSGKIDVDKVFDSNGDVVHETRYVHLAKDENDLRDNVSIAINQDFLESVALINIEKRLRAFRDKYTRNHSAEKSAQ